MHRRLANCHPVAIALVFCLLGSGLVRAQADMDAFSDVELPQLDDAMATEDLPPPEGLPLGPQTVAGPQIDSSSPGPSSIAPTQHSDTPSRDPADEQPAVDDDEIDAGPSAIEPDETIRERYPDGRIRIERGVRQDELQNYLNHGSWKMWDPGGRPVMEGAYRNGQPEGLWTRWYRSDDADLLRQSPFTLFERPLVSQATFRAGQLHGQWTITDRNERKICEWNFVDGRRHGKSLWWYQNGNTMREINYADGQIHGELLEWDEGGRLITRVEYQEGRRLAQTVQNDKTGEKQIEGMVLHARLVLKEPDNWWKTTLATYAREGKDQKHGDWAAWYPDGKQKFTGHYEYDQPVGRFTWWHSNGQKALEGTYQDEGKHGTWTWWHENGQKSIEGQYRGDTAVGRWVWWQENGKVAQRVDFSKSGGRVVTLPHGRPDIDAQSIGRSIMLNRPQNEGDPRGGGE